MKLLQKLGHNPNKSFTFFVLGLVCFFIGLGLIYFLGEFSYLQMFSLTLVGLGCLLAIWGYIGIFASRILTMLNQHPKTKD